MVNEFFCLCIRAASEKQLLSFRCKRYYQVLKIDPSKLFFSTMGTNLNQMITKCISRDCDRFKVSKKQPISLAIGFCFTRSRHSLLLSFATWISHQQASRVKLHPVTSSCIRSSGIDDGDDILPSEEDSS